jgi:hypothetical protein
MRAPGSIASIAALLWGFQQAPFLHIHPEETDHPAAPVEHIHVPAHLPPGPAIYAHTADDDEIDLEWRIAQPPAAALVLDLAFSGTVAIPVPPVVSAPLVTPQPRGHDPPDLIPKQPRAPPA